MTCTMAYTLHMTVASGEHAFSCAGPAAFNWLPETIRQAQTQALFKKLLKTYSQNFTTVIELVMSAALFASGHYTTMMMTVMMYSLDWAVDTTDLITSNASGCGRRARSLTGTSGHRCRTESCCWLAYSTTITKHCSHVHGRPCATLKLTAQST